MDLSWSETRRCFGELEELLSCGICKVLVLCPVSLGGCEHFFCRQCVEDVTDCPVCSLPSRAKDIKTDRQLVTAVSLCQQLQQLLIDSDSDTEKCDDEHEDVPASGIEVLPGESLPSTPLVSSKPVSGSPLSVYDYLSSPCSYSPSASVAGRTRKRAKVTKRKKALVKSNELWQIGKKDMLQKCDSCDKSKKVKSFVVKFNEKEGDKTVGHGGCECVLVLDGSGTGESADDKPQSASKSRRSKKSAKRNSGVKSVPVSKRISPRERRTVNAENSDTENYISIDVDTDASDLWSGPSTFSRATRLKDAEETITIGSDTCDEKNVSMENLVAEEPEMIRTRRKRNSSKNRQPKPNVQVPDVTVSQPWVEVTPLKGNRLTSVLTGCNNKQSPINSVGKKGKKGRGRGQHGQDYLSPSTSINSVSGTGVTGVSGPKKCRRSIGSPAASSIKSSAGIGSPLPLNKKNAKGETPLQVAAIKGDLSRVRSLLQEGATTNVKDNAGWTPLHEACNHGFREIAELLLDHGAFINIPGLDNDTPLHDAVTNGKLDCVRLLVSRGASLTARNIHGKTPPDLAVTEAMREALDTPVREDMANQTSTSLSPRMMINQVVFLPTGMSRDKKSIVQKCAQMLHGRIVEEYSGEVTHVIATVNAEGQCGKTLKCLQALLAGKWIVNFSWIEVCLEYKDRVSEEAFEVPGTSGFPITMAPSRARNNVLQQLPGLFDGCQFYLHGDFTYPAPSKEDLTTLLKSGGGSILSREPKQETVDQSEWIVPYHADPKGNMANCSYYKVWNLREFELKMINSRMCEVSYQWILDCIANFKISETPL